MSKRILITGTSGFVGHHTVEHILKNTDWDVVGIDMLDYSSEGYDRLRDIEVFTDKRVTLHSSDVSHPLTEGLKKEMRDIPYIVHMAAGSHVDNSIDNPVPFIQNNVNNALHMLEFARELKQKGCLKKFVYFSTDEVYGTAPEGVDFKEGDRFNPGNPYSASKAAAECLCYAYANTYKLPIMITNTMNILGERQHPEKFFPKTVNYVLDQKVLPIHSNPEKTQAGKRHYIHARNVADGLVFLLKNSDEFLNNIDASKGKFNIVGEKELDNLQLAQLIAKYVGKPLRYELVDFHSSRPGHDLRYSLDGSKMEKLGWKPPVGIEESIRKIVEWSLDPKHIRWLGREAK